MKNGKETIHLGLLCADDKYRLAITACHYEAVEEFEDVTASPNYWLVTCEKCIATPQYKREIADAVAKRMKNEGTYQATFSFDNWKVNYE